MDVGLSLKKPSVINENDQQKALLAWATTRIDQITGFGAGHQLDDYLDWLAYFTREFFGFQQRMLKQCGEQRDYLVHRMEAHCEFRRRLARLSIDMIRNDPTVPERLRSLCHDLLEDAEANERKLAEILDRGTAPLKLRKQPRRAQPAKRAAQLFEQASDDDTSVH